MVFCSNVSTDAEDTHRAKTPTGLRSGEGEVFLQRYHPYGIQEVFEVFKFLCTDTVRLGHRDLP